MTHRLDVKRSDGTIVLDFQGVLDLDALAGLTAGVASARSEGASARIVLRAGTEVERTCLAGLRALDAEVVAESAYLARWLAAGPRG